MTTENNWRFIDTGSADGAFNMAADEALARSIISNQPVVRVYRWQPYAISIGYNQNFHELNRAKCTEDGIDIVRRPTGGGAIFHAHELTYSVIIPRSHFYYEKNNIDLYNQISSAIIRALNYQGSPVALEKKSPDVTGANREQHYFACFVTSAQYEIHYQSKKLVGSAQRRFKNAVLQHGSVILGDEHRRILDYMSLQESDKTRDLKELLHENTVSLQTILNRNIAYKELVQNMKAGFEDHFKIHLEVKNLTDEELNVINVLKTNYMS
ncbi:MAG: biotin/lipoate A/B protein ligase family protein [bacterium]